MTNGGLLYFCEKCFLFVPKRFFYHLPFFFFFFFFARRKKRSRFQVFFLGGASVTSKPGKSLIAIPCFFFKTPPFASAKAGPHLFCNQSFYIHMSLRPFPPPSFPSSFLLFFSLDQRKIKWKRLMAMIDPAIIRTKTLRIPGVKLGHHGGAGRSVFSYGWRSRLNTVVLHNRPKGAAA